MKMRKPFGAALASLLLLPGIAALSDDVIIDKDWSTQRLSADVTEDFVWMATNFAECGGLYGTLAAAKKQFFFTSMSSTELIEKYLEATTLAGWLMAEEHYSRTGEETAAADFAAEIEKIAFAKAERLADLVVSDDLQSSATVLNERHRCDKLNELQVLVQRQRDLRAKLAAMVWPTLPED